MRSPLVLLVIALWMATETALASSSSISARNALQEPIPIVDAITGRVVDTDGAPVAGLEFVLVPRNDARPNVASGNRTSSPMSMNSIPRTTTRVPPDDPLASRASSGSDGAFRFEALDPRASYELFVTPGSHTVLAFPHSGICVPGDRLELTAHELVDVMIDFAPVEGAPTRGLLVQDLVSLGVEDLRREMPFGEDFVVDAPHATLRLVRGRHHLEVSSWSGSNENKGSGGSAWRWTGVVDVGSSVEPTLVTLAPRRHVDVFVRNSPFEGPYARLTAQLSPATTPDQPQSLKQTNVDASSSASFEVASGTGRHVVRLLSVRGRLLLEREVELDRPRVAVRFDLGELVASPVFLRIALPAGSTLDGLSARAHIDPRQLEELSWTLERDGRLRFESVALSEALQSGSDSRAPATLSLALPRLGALRLELAANVFEYSVTFAPKTFVRLNFIGAGAADVVARCHVTAGPIDPVDGFAPHFEWGAHEYERGIVRVAAENCISIDDLQPGLWRFVIALSPDEGRWNARGHRRVLAVLEETISVGEQAFEISLPKEHGVSLWCPAARTEPRSIAIMGEGRRFEAVTDADGRLRFDGLFAGRYVIDIDHERVPDRFEIVLPCDEVIWAGRPHDALRVVIARPDSPLVTAGLQNGDLVIGFDGIAFRQQPRWQYVTATQSFGGDIFDGPAPPHTAFEVWRFTAARSVNLRVQRGEAVIDLAVGPIAAHTPEELEALGGTLTPVYREF